MPSIYKRATDAEHQILNELVADHYKDINAVGVSFDIIFAYAGENDAGEKIGPALKERGYQCTPLAGS